MAAGEDIRRTQLSIDVLKELMMNRGEPNRDRGIPTRSIVKERRTTIRYAC